MGVIARTYDLHFPNERIFDEVYFPVFANDYLTRTAFFDVHPPFGKWLIAIGMFIFKDNPLGWRIIPAIFGLAIVPLFALISLKQNKSVVSAVIMFALLSVETILISYSRSGLMDGILFFFIFACWLYTLRVTKPKQLIWLAVLLGLTFSIKWMALGVLAPIGYIMWRKKMLWRFILSLTITVVIYQAFVMLGQAIIASSNPWLDGWYWNQHAWNYHLTLTATHPWGSQWWTWPLLTRPVLFYFNEDSGGVTRLITAIGNPLVWWTSGLAVIWSVIYLMWQRFRLKLSIADHVLTPLLIGFFAFWLPWMPIKRVLFNYHYLPAYGMALLILGYWLNIVWHKQPWLCLLIVIILLSSGLYFIPWGTGTGLSHFWLARHVWVNSWLY